MIHAYQQDPTLHAQGADRARALHAGQASGSKLITKGAKIPYIEVIEFDNRMEELIAGAKAVVAMGGYNTYCEILSFDKPALIVPRVEPREEQLIRARARSRTRPDRHAAAGGSRGRRCGLPRR